MRSLQQVVFLFMWLPGQVLQTDEGYELMKKSCTFVLTVALATSVVVGGIGSLRTEKKTIKEGEVTLKKTFRGEQVILAEMDNKGKKSRAFRINGKTVAAESDEDGDGFFEDLMIFDPDTGDFEWFARGTNGSITPVTTERLEELKGKTTAADERLKRLMDAVRKDGIPEAK